VALPLYQCLGWNPFLHFILLKYLAVRIGILTAQKNTENAMRFEIDRNPTEKIIIEDTEFKGKELVSLRIHFLSKEDEWLPTKKGVTFRRDQLEEVIDALNKINAG
jgi:outer membrane protein assembly factor BamA